MLVEMSKQMLAALIKGCDPAYEIMEHPLIKTKGYYSGGHNDRWNWNYSFGDCTEEQLWETYQLLQTPEPYKDKTKVYGGPCSIDELYNRLYALEGVTWVYIEDHYNLDVSITVEGGDDEQIASVLCSSLTMRCRTLGDYQVSVMLSGYLMTYRIYREMKVD